MFDTDGDPGDEYEFSEDDNNSNESDISWQLSLKYDYYEHTFVHLIRIQLSPRNIMASLLYECTISVSSRTLCVT